MQTRTAKVGPLGKFVRAATNIFPENHFLQTSRYIVRSQKIPPSFDGFRLVHLSDLHGCTFGRNNSRLLYKIEEESPEAIMLTGDIADRQMEHYGKLFQFVKALCAECSVYFVDGNHEEDLSSQKRHQLMNGLRLCGVHLLDNCSAKLEHGKEFICLSGYRVPLRYYRADGHGKARPQLKAETVSEALGTCNQQEYHILLAHNPLFFEAYAAWGADLTLSGHIHGGMIRLPHYGALLSPERSFFPRYSEGIYRSQEFPERQMAVSRGLGCGARINNIPEIVVLTLRHAQEGGTAEPQKG
jgi:predicted MPP superfamily phosphohydrolase